MVTDLQLVFAPESVYQTEWTVPLSTDGTYRAKLDFYSSETRFCVSLHRARRLNSIPLKCGSLVQGLQRLDVDTDGIPPGVVHVNATPIDVGGFVNLTITPVGKGTATFDRTYKLLRGLRGDYLAEYGEYDIIIRSHDRTVVLASSRVSVSPERPVQDVELNVRATP